MRSELHEVQLLPLITRNINFVVLVSLKWIIIHTHGIQRILFSNGKSSYIPIFVDHKSLNCSALKYNRKFIFNEHCNDSSQICNAHHSFSSNITCFETSLQITANGTSILSNESKQYSTLEPILIVSWSVVHKLSENRNQLPLLWLRLTGLYEWTQAKITYEDVDVWMRLDTVGVMFLGMDTEKSYVQRGLCNILYN